MKVAEPFRAKVFQVRWVLNARAQAAFYSMSAEDRLHRSQTHPALNSTVSPEFQASKPQCSAGQPVSLEPCICGARSWGSAVEWAALAA